MQLDHYNGRRLEDVISVGDEAWEWALVFEGGVIVKNKDKRRTARPSDYIGSSLALVTYGEMGTELIFGISTLGSFTESGRITLTPALYTLADPARQGENTEEVYPQMPTQAELAAVRADIEEARTENE